MGSQPETHGINDIVLTPDLVQGQKPLLTEFDIHHRLESCGMSLKSME